MQKKCKLFSVPITKEVNGIDKNGELQKSYFKTCVKFLFFHQMIALQKR